MTTTTRRQRRAKLRVLRPSFVPRVRRLPGAWQVDQEAIGDAELAGFTPPEGALGYFYDLPTPDGAPGGFLYVHALDAEHWLGMEDWTYRQQPPPRRWRVVIAENDVAEGEGHRLDLAMDAAVAAARRYAAGLVLALGGSVTWPVRTHSDPRTTNDPGA